MRVFRQVAAEVGIQIKFQVYTSKHLITNLSHATSLILREIRGVQIYESKSHWTVYIHW